MNIKNVVVAGGGVLGSQIAFQAAYKGFNVKVWLRMESSIGRAKPKFERVEKIYLETLQAMKTKPQAYCRGFAHIKLTKAQIDDLIENAAHAMDQSDLLFRHEEAAKDADLVIEAIAENPTEKVEFYQAMAKYLPNRQLLSLIPLPCFPVHLLRAPDALKSYLALHFANEIWRNNTAEVMGHAGTSPEAYKEVVEFAEALGMIPLQLKKEQPGYILNSLLVPFLNSAQALLATGVADPETIDKTWQLGTGAPLGPFAS